MSEYPDIIKEAIKEALDDEEGRIEFDVERGDIFQQPDNPFFILNLQSLDGNADARIYRSSHDEFVLEHYHRQCGSRRCAVRTANLKEYDRIHMACSWSPSELRFEVSPTGVENPHLVRSSVDTS